MQWAWEPSNEVGHLAWHGLRSIWEGGTQSPSSRGSRCVGSLQLFGGAPCPSDPAAGGPAVPVAALSSAAHHLVGAAPPPCQKLFSRQPESL